MDLIDIEHRLAVRRARVATAAVAAAAIALGGCALSISGPQPVRRRLETPKCDTGKGAVVLDGLWATAFGVAGLTALSNDEPEIGALALVLGGLFVASAYRGHQQAEACGTAFEHYNQEVLAIRRPAIDPDAVAVPRPRTRRAPIDPQPASTAPRAATHAREDAPIATSDAPPTPATKAAPFMAPRPQPAAAKPAPVPAATDDDDWSEFWQEVP